MKKNLIILLIVAFGLCLRLAYVYSISERTFDGISDGRDYDAIAFNIVSGNGYANADGNLTSRRAPLTPAFFALIYFFFGHSISAVRIAQAFVGAFTCFIIYLLGREIFTRKVGLIAAAVAAIYPSFLVYTGELFTETILVFTLALSLYFLLKKKGSKYLNSFISGIFFGAAVLGRPSILLLPILIFFILAVFKREDLKEMLKRAAILILTMLIIICPWTLRNYRVHKDFVLVSTDCGYMAISSYFYSEKGFGFSNDKLADELAEGAKSETKIDKILTNYTMRRLAEDPGKFIKLLPLKLLWFWEPFGGRDYNLGSCYDLIYGLVFLFFLFGLIGSRYMWRELLPIYTVIVYFALMSLIAYPSRRFRMQIEPFVIVLASYGFSWVAEERRKNKIISFVVTLGLAANLFFFIFADSVKNLSKKFAFISGYNAFYGDK